MDSIQQDRTEISVVIPAHNAAAFLEDAVSSVLGQTIADRLEIILVDDGSKDDTAALIDQLAGSNDRIRGTSKTCGGSASARNEGVRLSNGHYLAFLDADDTWEPDKLEKQLEAQEETGSDLIFTQVVEFADFKNDEAAPAKPRVDPFSGLLPSTVFMKRETFDRIGWMNEELQAGEFIEWLTRAKQLNLRKWVIEEVLCRRRIHHSNHGILHREKYGAEYLKVVRARMRARAKPQSDS